MKREGKVILDFVDVALLVLYFSRTAENLVAPEDRELWFRCKSLTTSTPDGQGNVDYTVAPFKVKMR